MTNINLVRAGAALSFVGRTVTSSGLVTVALDSATGSMIECNDGISVTGIKITDSGGVDATGAPQYHEAAIILRGKPGATVTIVHEDTGETAAYRIRCSTGDDMTLEEDSFVVLVYRYAESRWVAHDLRGATGATGSTGATGATGSQGPQGDPGPSILTSFIGTTAGSGTYSETYGSPFSNTPAVAVQLIGGTNSPHQFARLTTSTTSGFTVTTYQRSSVNLLATDVLLATTSTVNGLTVNVLVCSRD